MKLVHTRRTRRKLSSSALPKIALGSHPPVCEPHARPSQKQRPMPVKVVDDAESAPRKTRCCFRHYPSLSICLLCITANLRHNFVYIKNCPSSDGRGIFVPFSLGGLHRTSERSITRQLVSRRIKPLSQRTWARGRLFSS